MSSSISPAASVTPPSLLGNLRRDRASGVSSVVAAMRKHWPLVVATTLLLAAGALLYSKSLPRVYDATALIELNATVIHPLGSKADDLDSAAAGAWWDSQEYYETEYRIITSQRILTTVARDLNLTSDSSFAGARGSAAKPMSYDAAADLLRSRVHVEPVKNSKLFTLHVEDTDPKRARSICSAIANTFIEQNLQTAINGSSDAAAWLGGQLDLVKRDLEGDEDALHAFKEKNELPSTSINDASNMVRLEMQEYDTALTRIRTKKQELLARYTELSKVDADNPDQIPSSELLSDPFLQHIREQYLGALRDRQELMADGKGENHPLVKAATQRLAQSREALLAQIKSIQGAVERDLAVVIREEAGELQLFDASRRRAVDLNMKEIEYRRLDRARELNEKTYAMLNEREKQADLARMMRVNNILLVDDALEPISPIRPRTGLNLAMGIVLGLLLGVGLSWTRERLDTSVKTPDDLEDRLGVTFLGLLPELADNETPRQRGRARRRRTASAPEGPSELFVHHRPLSGVAEAARSIRTNLMFMNPDKPYRRLLVTSAAPAEGKTTVACSIAIAFAQGGQRVCIIDCDLRRPRLHRIFQRAGDMGVTNVLVGDATLDDVAKPTGIENLWSIPAGPTPPNPADMFHSERFRRFIADVSERFDRVIIDSPPLVAVTDSAIISTIAHGVVFVVRAFKTNSHLSSQGLRTLRDVDAPIVGGVLNAVNLNRQEYSYYYHYYYYKREGYGSDQPAEGNDEVGAAPPN
ncbi:MAG TPA: polysaccharide biosynthesis tyrosine autokinase [Polyangiaceae bacterium]